MENTTKDSNLLNEKIIQRSDKEGLINQTGVVLWFTGLSGSGKTSISNEVERLLFEKGFLTQHLDGDIIRKGINKDLGFSLEERFENLRRVAEIAKILIECGIIAICSFISPTVLIRNSIKNIIGKENIIEIYINTPLKICESRDVKGLYRKARSGVIGDFTGISSPYEPPQYPDLEILTKTMTIAAAAEKVYDFLLFKIQEKKK